MYGSPAAKNSHACRTDSPLGCRRWLTAVESFSTEIVATVFNGPWSVYSGDQPVLPCTPRKGTFVTRIGWLARCSRWGFCWLAGVAWPLFAWGQAPAPAPVAPAAPTFATRNYMVDAAIFVGLAGAAIYAVVRSSKRV